MTSTDDSMQVFANGSSNNSRITTYEDLIENYDLFWDKFFDFLGYDVPFEPPIIGGISLNLHKLFIEVTTRGGFEKVITARKCKQVIETFDFKTPITNGSFVIKKYYVPFLLKLEHVFYFNKPVSSYAAREKEVQLLLAKSTIHDDELQAGTAVHGIIDGKFDHGYFVTVKMGTEELKGVLYHLYETPIRKKIKDPLKPKSRRTSYNFFFTDYYWRLKPGYVGREQYLTKKLAAMWRILSPSSKEDYQEKAAMDVERYNREMVVYNASRAAQNVAAPNAAAATEADAAMNDVDSDATVSDALMNDAAEYYATDSDAAMNDAVESDAVDDTNPEKED
ncbi:hypothetical protein AALP_AA4G010100 [Arabis alpina]|uniref:HMG box domain-containing protein n=1 Tax=Arabis alpina TaxID=50452 RepID=A0A087H0D4_ARAAL|nr:hypothetical protein AALP_AA4G010100 [Arabis alpina]